MIIFRVIALGCICGTPVLMDMQFRAQIMDYIYPIDVYEQMVGYCIPLGLCT